jgi:metallophosphoesterase (TIGR00282 family)
MNDEIKVLFIGDIVGSPGIKAIGNYLPVFNEKYEPDLVIFNGENAADGKGITNKETEQFLMFGADIITTGNHVWDNWKGKPLLAKSRKVLRPLNYPQGNPGLGYSFIELPNGKEAAVMNLQGRTFMQTIDCPFKSAEYALKNIRERTNIIIIDFHADATAEKMAFAWFFDGKVSAIIGTHTHIQTNDTRIMPNGTGYITDVGMTGPYDSVLGMRKDIAIRRFTLQTPHKFEMAENDIKISGVFLKINAGTGKTTFIESFIYPKFNNS